MGKSFATRAISEWFSETWVWMGWLVSLCRAPSSESIVEVHEGAKRGVMIGVMSDFEGSMEAIWSIVARVSATAAEKEASL